MAIGQKCSKVRDPEIYEEITDEMNRAYEIRAGSLIRTELFKVKMNAPLAKVMYRISMPLYYVWPSTSWGAKQSLNPAHPSSVTILPIVWTSFWIPPELEGVSCEAATYQS